MPIERLRGILAQGVGSCFGSPKRARKRSVRIIAAPAQACVLPGRQIRRGISQDRLAQRRRGPHCGTSQLAGLERCARSKFKQDKYDFERRTRINGAKCCLDQSSLGTCQAVMLSCGNKRSVGRKYKKAGFPTTTKKSASSTRAAVHSLRHYRPMARSSWYTDEIEGFDELDNSESHGTIRRARRFLA